MGFFDVSERICPNCGMTVPEGNRFCEECGTPYTEKEKTPPTHTPPKTGKKMFCPNGHAVNDGEFCLVCGSKLVDTVPEPDPTPDPEPNVGWVCSKCFAVNSDDSIFCTNCGGSRNEKTEPSGYADKSTGKTTEEKTIPDIPSIMQPLTEDDMKR